MINILSKDTIDKIAAGEIAERPESVVKELLDNAVDSGADKISIEIRGGGLELIRVTDNGCGIEASEIGKAFLRHATSKLRTAGDLEHIMSMGFRGEALASIASVSCVEMITKTGSALSGTDYRIEFGIEKDIREVGVPDGTTVIVRDFLENVPVRRQFLKSARTETSYIVNTAEKTALAHPDISITLNIDGRCIFSTSGNGRLKDAVYTVFGSNVALALRKVDHVRGSIRISGYTGEPDIARSKRDQEIFFVNGRWISSEILQRGLEDAFAPYMMQHRYPFAVLNITIPPEEVDVNVHPRKSEVRFASDQAVYDAVYGAVSEAMSQKELIFDAGREVLKKLQPESAKESKKTERNAVPPEPFEENRRSEAGTMPEDVPPDHTLPFSEGKPSPNMLCEKSSGYGNALDISGRAEEAGTAENKSCEQASVTAQVLNQDPAQGFFSRNNLSRFKMTGQIFDTYWIIELNDELYIIDQHAAHEKVYYERFTALIKSHQTESQMIYPPMVLTLGAREALLLEDNLQLFTDAGYDIEYAGDRDFIVRAVPSNLPELNDRELLISMIDSLFEDGKAPSAQLLEDKIASMSCKAAVKGRMSISEKEMRQLIEELLTLENPYNCPHGRPTIVKLSRQDIEKLFKRIV